MKLLNGIYSAIFSVYDRDMNVIKDTVTKLVDNQLKNGLKGFYVCGNTGECTVLPVRTRKLMLEAVEEANRGRGQVIAHVGAGRLEDVLDLLDHANGTTADAVSSLPLSLMSYYKPDEVVEYYKLLAKKSKKPVYAYVTPVLSGSPVDFAAEIAKIDNIAGIKLTINDYFTFGKITAAYGEHLNILNGPDETMICGLIEGADGAIGTTYNICPAHAVSIYNAFMKGDVKNARALQHKMNTVIVNKLAGKGMARWKGLMNILGYDMGYTVFPANIPSAEELKAMEAEYKAAGLFEICERV